MGYFREVLGIKHVWRKPGDLDAFPGEPAIWWMQENLINILPKAIEERKHIYVASGHSLGKDFICGGVGLWFLQSHIPSLVVLTAPTSRQVNDIMYKETIGHWERKLINLGGKAYTEPKIMIEKDWYLVGFTTKETTDSKDSGGAKFQGFKGKDNVCIIVTEAQAVDETIYDQIDAISTGKNTLVIFLGNPTRAKGRFAAGLRNKKDNFVFHLSCLENPNYIERRTIIPGLASYDWVEKTVRPKWNADGEEDDPRWIGRVLGQIPDNATAQVFSYDTLEHMRGRHGFLAQYSDNRGVALDPAGEGVDDNVFLAGSGGEVIEFFTKTRMPPSVTALKAIELCKKINGTFVIVDCDGLGQRDYAELMLLPDTYKQGIQIIPFHGSAPSKKTIQLTDKKTRLLYGNMRAEAAFVAQERALAGRAAIPNNDPELREDLETDEYFEKRGVIWIIDKDEVKSLLGRSPGKGDSWKMFQWAMDQNFKAKTSYAAQGKNPAYGLMEGEEAPVTLSQLRGLPRYGNAE